MLMLLHIGRATMENSFNVSQKIRLELPVTQPLHLWVIILKIGYRKRVGKIGMWCQGRQVSMQKPER